MTFRLVSARTLRLFAMLSFLLCVAVLWPTAARAAHTSLLCAAKNATVPSGGSVVIDVTDCAEVLAFAGDGAVDGPKPPDKGSATLRITSTEWLVDYVHFGADTVTDTFEFSDTDGRTVLVTVTVTPPASAIVVAPGNLPALTAGTAFSQTLTATGGAAPYTYTLLSGTLPGVSLTGDVISGAPSRRGTYNLVVRATDNNGDSADKPYSGTVANPSLSLASSSGTAIQNVAYTGAVVATGGVAPYTYTLENFTWPAGISMASDGTLSGTTNAAPGNYGVRVRVTDSSTGPGSWFEVLDYTLTVSTLPSVSIAVSPASVAEDSGTALVYTVTRSANLSSPTTVTLTYGGTATPGTDYTGEVSTVVIPAGATTATVSILPTADTEIESNETVIVTVANGSGYTVGSPSSATGTITNDDVPVATITVSPASVAEDSGTPLVYTVTLDQPYGTLVQVNYSVGGNGLPGTDYTVAPSPLSIPAGQTSRTITVTPVSNTVVGPDKTVVLTLAAGSNYTVGTPSTATGTIVDDDQPRLSINDVSLNEGNAGTTAFTFTVSLDSPAGAGDVTFDFATQNGTATAGVDYGAASGSVRILAGASSATITVLVNGDALNEPDKTFFVNLTNVTGATVLDGQGQGTIVNDDPQPSLSIGSVSQDEGNSGNAPFVFTVTLSAASGQMVTVNYQTADDTAVAGTDYVLTSGALTFMPGVTTRTVSVPVIGNLQNQPDRTFFVNLTAASNASLGTAQGTGTIVDDDEPVQISPPTLPNGQAGAAYSQTIQGTGGTSTLGYSVSAGALPAGLTLSAGGTLSGTPTAVGTFNFTVRVQDSNGNFATQPYSIAITLPALVVPPATAQTVGRGESAQIDYGPVSGGVAPYSWAMVSGALPPGLSMDTQTGRVSGTPTALGTFNFVFRASDSSTGAGPGTLTQSTSISVVEPVPVAGATSLSVSYNAAATAVPLVLSGGVATAVQVVAAPANGSAVVNGLGVDYTPAAGFAGADTFTYTASNANGTSSPATVAVTVADPVLSVVASGSLAASVAQPYSQTFNWSGGHAPYGSQQVANLPAGVTVTGTTATSVTISGTPTTVGTFALQVSATDSSTGTGPFTDTGTFSLVISGPTLSLSPAAGALPQTTAGVPWQQTFSAAAGIAPYSYSASGTLPPGLTMDASSGALAGTPTAGGAYSFTITATDSTGGTAANIAQAYTLQVAAPLTLLPGSATVLQAEAGTAFAQQVAASGGIAPYQYSVVGALPAGVTLDAGSGLLSGTPSASGSFALTVTVTDSTPGTAAIASANYTLQVSAPTLALTPANLAAATAGVAYQQQFAASGGIAPYQYSVAGALPAGLTLDAGTGLLSGLPVESGSFALTITATDSTAGSAATISNSLTLQVAVPTVTITAATFATLEAGTPFEHTFAASGGIAPYRYTVSGTLPPGLTLDAASGVLSGTPTTSGTFTLTLTVVDSTAGTAASASQTFSLMVAAPTLVLGPAATALPPAVAGTAYTASFAASGGIAPYSYSMTGTLPAGLTLDAASGVLSGTPTTAGSFSFTLTATDSTGGTPASASVAQTLQVTAPALAMTPAAGALPQAVAGESYEQVFTSSGGIAPYIFAVSEGALPAGLVLDAASGRLSGTAAAAGDATFSITATDSTGGSAATLTQAYRLSVVAPVLTLTPETLPAGIFGREYQAQLSASGGTAPYRYRVSAGALAAGLTLEQNGRLSGTPSAGGSFTVTLTATDAKGFSGQRDYVLQIAERPDPTRDAEVRGLLDAQADAARRFARSQIDNFQQRMQRLHGASRNGGFSNTLSLAASSQRNCDRGPAMKVEPECDRQRRRPFDAEREPEATAAAMGSEQDEGVLGLWIGGSVRSGRNGSGRGAGTDFESDGLTVGTDYRVSEAFVLGAGVGYGKDRSDVGQLGSRSDGQAWTMAVYGSYSPGQRVFVDMLLGHQLLDYTLRRHVTADGSFVHGRRDGQQWFGSLALGADFGNGPWQLTPYARLDASHGELDAYGEQGGSLFGLVYGNQVVRATTGNAGVRMAWQNTRPWGGWRPNLQVEYQHDFSGSGSATMQYADLQDVPFYRTTLDGFERNRWMLGAGVQFDFRRHWGLRVDYRGLVGSDDRDHGVQISLDKQL